MKTQSRPSAGKEQSRPSAGKEQSRPSAEEKEQSRPSAEEKEQSRPSAEDVKRAIAATTTCSEAASLLNLTAADFIKLACCYRIRLPWSEAWSH